MNLQNQVVGVLNNMNNMNNTTIENNKVFYNPGDLVKVRHELDYSPVMYVVEKTVKTFINKETSSKESLFTGIKCR